MMTEETEFLDENESSYESYDSQGEDAEGTAENFDIPSFEQTGDANFDQFLMEKGGEPEDWIPDMAAEGILHFDFETGEVTVAATGELWTPPDQAVADALVQWKEGDLSIVGVPEYVVRTEESITRYEGFMYVKENGAMGYQMYKNEQFLPAYDSAETTDEDGNESIPHVAEPHEAPPSAPEAEHIETELTSLEHVHAVSLETPTEIEETLVQETTQAGVTELRVENGIENNAAQEIAPKVEAAAPIAPREIHTEIERNETSTEISDTVRDILEGDKLPTLAEIDFNAATPTIETVPTPESPVRVEIPEVRPEYSLVADMQQAFREVVASVSAQLESIAIPTQEAPRVIEPIMRKEDAEDGEPRDEIAPTIEAKIEQQAITMHIREESAAENSLRPAEIPQPMNNETRAAAIDTVESAEHVAPPIQETNISAIQEKQPSAESASVIELRVDRAATIDTTSHESERSAAPELRVVASNEIPRTVSENRERTISAEQEAVLRSIGIPLPRSREQELHIDRSPESNSAPRGSAIAQDDTALARERDRATRLNGIVMRRAA